MKLISRSGERLARGDPRRACYMRVKRRPLNYGRRELDWTESVSAFYILEEDLPSDRHSRRYTLERHMLFGRPA